MILNKQLIENKIDKNLSLIVYKTIDSTNTQAKIAAERGEYKRAVFIAGEQTAGRGRLGRSFVSSENKGLYLSILLNEELSASLATSLTTYMAVAASRAIRTLSGLEVKIKWVNDLYSGGKKLAGILTEGKAADGGERLAYAVVGIGINVRSQEFPEDVKGIATTLEDECQTSFDVNELASLIINEFFADLHLVGTKQIADEYKSRSFVIGKHVTVVKPTVRYEALVTDITDKCELKLLLADGTEEILSTGEVSIRPV